MRIHSILREAWHNVTSGTARAVLLTAVLAVLGLTALASEILVISGLEREADDFKGAGGSILTVAAPGRVDGPRCDGLADVPGVRAAGAIALPPAERVSVVALPGAPLPYGYTTPGFPAVVNADMDGGPGLLVSGDAVRLLGARVGATLRTTDGETRVAGVYEYPRDGRRNGYGYLALDVAGPVAAFDECWVDAWPQNPAMRSLILTSVLPGSVATDEQPEVAPLNVTHGLEFDGHERYRQRITQWSGTGVGLVAAFIGFVALRARRVELASALHDRMSKVDLGAVVCAETVTWVAPPVVLTFVTGAAYFAHQGEMEVGLVLGARIATLMVAGAFAGVGLGVALTRERDLFLYAKDR
jgi:hypothetical protein